MKDRRGTYNLPIRISYWEDEEVKHIQERAILRVCNEAVHHEGHRGRADPLSSVNTFNISYILWNNLLTNTIPPSINIAGLEPDCLLFLFLKYNSWCFSEG